MIPPEIGEEIRLYGEMVEKFRAGTVGPEGFRRFRLQHGIYGQRQEGVQMVRIKIPLGRLTADQIDCVADLAETYGHKNAHVTTRQDIQIHYVKLENTPEIMRRLAEVGLTTREACGNTVRNVTASPTAGVDPKEAFDVTPYAHAFAYHLLRNPVCQNLPRKFKVAFDGAGVVTALPLIHDIGLIARIEKGKRGFEVHVGGGLGSYPRLAVRIFDFLPVEDLLRFGEAILRVFDRYGERRVRSKARMKFLIEKFGFERFAKLVKNELGEVELPRKANDYLTRLGEWEEKVPPSPPALRQAQGTAPLPQGGEGGLEFLAWKKTNVWPQKQKGYSMVEIRLTTGDIAPDPLHRLAAILRRYAGGKVRTMVHQNFLIRWVRNQDLPALYVELNGIGLAKKDPQTIYDVTACPGTDTCRLGITSSVGLARVIERRLYQEDGRITALARDLRIKISGCPSACGQHHIANIGLYGGAIASNGRHVPAFRLMLGGNFGRETVIATPIVQVPSKNVPEAVIRLVKYFAEQREGTETFNDFYGRRGKEAVVRLLGDLLKVPSYEERPDFYLDWEDQKEFALQKGVIGECAGAMGTDIPPRVTDGDAPLQMAEALFDHGEFESAAAKAYEAIVKAANGLLSYRLVQTFKEVETTHEFENHFGRTGILPQWKGLHVKIEGLRLSHPDEIVAREYVSLAAEVVKSCHAKELALKTKPKNPLTKGEGRTKLYDTRREGIMKKIFLLILALALIPIPHLFSQTNSRSRSVPVLGQQSVLGQKDAQRIAAQAKIPLDVTRLAKAVKTSDSSLRNLFGVIRGVFGEAQACEAARQFAWQFPLIVERHQDKIAQKFGGTIKGGEAIIVIPQFVADKISRNSPCPEVECWDDAMNDVIFVDGGQGCSESMEWGYTGSDGEDHGGGCDCACFCCYWY